MRTRYIQYGGDTITTTDTYSIKYTVGNNLIINDRGTQASTFNAIIGNEYINEITGDLNGNNLIIGHGGNDIIIGGSGNDIIIGGSGNDLLTGGLGRDIFIYDNIDDGHDTINNFSMNYDVLNLAGLLSFNEEVDDLNQFIQIMDKDDKDTIIIIDADGLGDFSNENVNVSITLAGFTGVGMPVDKGGFDLSSMIADGSIVFQ